MRGRGRKAKRGVQADSGLYKRSAEEIGLSSKNFVEEANKPPPVYPSITVDQMNPVTDNEKQECCIASQISQRLSSSIWFREKRAVQYDIKRYADKYTNIPSESQLQQVIPSKIMELDPACAYFPPELTALDISHISHIVNATGKQSRFVMRKKGDDDDDDDEKNDSPPSVEESDTMSFFSEREDDGDGLADGGGDYDDL